jgi:hypothetical protein
VQGSVEYWLHLPLELGLADSIDFVEELGTLRCSPDTSGFEIVVVIVLIMGAGAVGLEVGAAALAADCGP